MGGNEEAVLGLAWILAGVFFTWNAQRAMSRKANLCTSIVTQMVLWSAMGFIFVLPAALGTYCASVDSMVPARQAVRSLSLIGLLAVSLIYACTRFLPDTWLIQDVSEDQINHILDKAMAQAELNPTRTLTGLEMAPDVTLRLYYWRLGRVCLLEWHPGGVAGRFSVFQSRLQELLAEVRCPPRLLAASIYTAMALVALNAGLRLLSGSI